MSLSSPLSNKTSELWYLTKVCAHNFYLYLVTVHSSSIANTQQEGMGSRDHRPSDKVAAQREAV
jgi:hypothetical protein